MMFLCPPAENGRSRSFLAKCPRVRPMMASLLTIAICFALVAPVVAGTYTGTNTGAIPDGSNPAPTCGAPRDVQFLVNDFTGGFGSASVSFTMSPQHTWVGDLQVSLIAPDLTSHLLFSRVGANTANDKGDNANLDGTYTFNDLSTGNIWAVAASSNSTNFKITNGSYRTQAAGPDLTDDPGPAFTSIGAAFASMNPANVNGIWTLRFLDCTAGDTGTVSAASLTLNPTLAGDVTLGGRVLTASGAGLKGAVVTVSGGDLAESRTMITGTFGSYMFDDLNAGQTYVVSVAAKRYTFATSAMMVSLDGDLSEVNFVSKQ